MRIRASATMLSTTLTVADAYPRVLRSLLELRDPDPQAHARQHRGRYLAGMAVTMVGAWLIIALFGRQFTLLIDFTTTVSFLAAPVLAWLNLKLLSGPLTPPAARPGPVTTWTARAGLLFLVAFCALWLWIRVQGF